MNSKLLTVAGFEFRRTAANKAFAVVTIIGPFLIAAFMFLPGLLGANSATEVPDDTVVGVSLSSPELGAAIVQGFQATGIKTLALGSVDELKREISADKVHFGLADALDGSGYVLYSGRRSSFAVPAIAQSLVRDLGMADKLAKAGLGQGEIAEIMAKPKVQSVKIGKDGQEDAQSEDQMMSNFFTVLSFMMLIYMTTLLYGQMIGRSVVQEKQSKTVEVMLSSVSPRQLMAGKILGIGIAGIIQYGVWIGMSMVFMYVVGPALSLSVPASLNIANLGWLFVFFILAYFLYAAAYAAVGAASEDEQQMGQLAMVFLIFLIIPLMLSSALVMGGDGMLGKVLSFFPLTAPVVMLTRIIAHNPSAIEIGASLAIIGLSIWGMSLGAAKIFRVGILMTGKKVNLKEMLAWIGKK
jgi:ABC-2 type transport system permease protein